MSNLDTLPCNIGKELTDLNNMVSISSLEAKRGRILEGKGLYCLALKVGHIKALPDEYQLEYLATHKENRLLYIGRAECLSKRLKQELESKGPGTLFRGVGAMLGFRPEKGSLRGKSRQNNYTFLSEDKKKIISWFEEHCEINCIECDDLSVEIELIKEYTPLLNDKHNIRRLKQLKEVRYECREIAKG